MIHWQGCVEAVEAAAVALVVACAATDDQQRAPACPLFGQEGAQQVGGLIQAEARGQAGVKEAALWHVDNGNALTKNAGDQVFG